MLCPFSSVILNIGVLTKLSLFFPVVCLIRVFDQTLAEQLYREKVYRGHSHLATGLVVL